MKNKLFVCVLLLIFPKVIEKGLQANFIVWNVGQGSWATFIDASNCVHFDMGGEVFPTQVLNLCSNKLNSLFLSHTDWDHISFIKRFKNNVAFFCLVYPTTSIKFLNKIKRCPQLHGAVKKIYSGNSAKSKNASSIVYLVENQVLLPGDSPISEEKTWLKKLKKPTPILILGHHGSATSTSVALLKRLRPKLAVASARKKKYGHPHRKVARKLTRFRCPLIRTEEHGHIFMQIKSFENKDGTPYPNP